MGAGKAPAAPAFPGRSTSVWLILAGNLALSPISLRFSCSFLELEINQMACAVEWFFTSCFSWGNSLSFLLSPSLCHLHGSDKYLLSICQPVPFSSEDKLSSLFLAGIWSLLVFPFCVFTCFLEWTKDDHCSLIHTFLTVDSEFGFLFVLFCLGHSRPQPS